jgi:arabinogalactan endo-1,4-beta-galactosidase
LSKDTNSVVRFAETNELGIKVELNFRLKDFWGIPNGKSVLTAIKGAFRS